MLTLRSSVRLSLVLGLVIGLATLAFGQRSRSTEYQCTSCGKSIMQERGSLPPKTCPHCGVRFDGMQTDDGRKVSFGSGPATQPVSNTTILGVLCGLVVLAAIGGGVAGIIFLVKQAHKKPKRRRVEYDDDDDDDDIDDRKPRRRRS